MISSQSNGHKDKPERDLCCFKCLYDIANRCMENITEVSRLVCAFVNNQTRAPNKTLASLREVFPRASTEYEDVIWVPTDHIFTESLAA